MRDEPPRSERRSRRAVAALLHAGVLGGMAALATQNQVVDPAVWAVAVAAAAASLAVEGLWGRGRRVWLGAALGGLLALAGAALAVTLLSGAPGTRLVVREAIQLGAGAAVLAGASRALGLWFWPWLSVEAVALVGLVAIRLSDHRDGMISRPLGLSDWAWAKGLDPSYPLYALGAAAAWLSLSALVRRGRALSAVLQIAAVLGLVAVAFVFGALQPAGAPDRPPPPPPEDRARHRADGTPSSSQSDAKRPVAVVVLERDVRPFGGVFYFRHAIFERYNGVRLVEAIGADRAPSEQALLDGQRRPPATEGRTAVRSQVGWLVPHRRAFGLLQARRLEPRPRPATGRFVRRYEVLSDVLTVAPEALLDVSPAAADERWLAGPADPRYRELAEKLRARLAPRYRDRPFALALAVKQYLEDSAIYTYDVDFEGAEDPTAAFLFGEPQRGYCVHLAHAAAFLLRALGVPARVSAGYGVPAAQLAGGAALLIRAQDAHAWAEVRLGPYGWVPLEVAPARSEVEEGQFEAGDLQRLLGEMLKEPGPEPTPAPARWAAARRDLARGFGGLLLMAVLSLYGARLGRVWLWPMFGGPGAAYRGALAALAGVGVRRRWGETPEAFAGRLRRGCPAFDGLVRSQSARVLGADRPGGALPSAPSPAALLASVRRQCRGLVPTRRRWWSVVDPLSWLRWR